MAGQRILVVDDAAETRNFLADSLLIPEGYDVVRAASGQEALTLAQTHPFHLIISDYLMPGMTGLELMQALKSHGLRTPFILMTAEGSETLAVRAMRLGVRDYHIKPFDIDDFLASIARVLEENQVNGRGASQLALSEVVGEAVDPILLTDEDHCLMYYNGAAESLFHLHGKIGLPIYESIPNAELLALFDGSPLAEVTVGENYYNAHLSPIPRIGKLVILQNITDLYQRDRARNDFVTSLSHDIRSPLTTILGYVELLERAGTLNEQQGRFVRNITFSVSSIKALLSDLLDLNKIEAGLERHAEAVPMEFILRYALEAHHSEIERRQQKITLEIAAELPPVRGNPVRLKQAIRNLLENATKYTPEGGKITVRLYPDTTFLIFQIQDSGIGIPVEDQPYIWDKLFRSENVVEDYPGSGLGLSIVKSIVEQHNGRVWVESTPGRGSTFTVMLPADAG